MCHKMHTKDIKDYLFFYLCNRPIMMSLKYNISITSKAYPFGGYVFIGKAYIVGHGF